MIIRPMTKDDKDDFYELCKEFYSSGATARGYDEAVTEKTFNYLMHQHENLWGYIIFDKELEKAVGYALVTSYWCNEDGGNVVILDELYIAPVDRHKGYAQALMRFVEEEFTGKAVSITLEVVTTNIAAKSLYAKFGYAQDGFEVLTKKI